MDRSIEIEEEARAYLTKVRKEGDMRPAEEILKKDAFPYALQVIERRIKQEREEAQKEAEKTRKKARAVPEALMRNRVLIAMLEMQNPVIHTELSRRFKSIAGYRLNGIMEQLEKDGFVKETHVHSVRIGGVLSGRPRREYVLLMDKNTIEKTLQMETIEALNQDNPHALAILAEERRKLANEALAKPPEDMG